MNRMRRMLEAIVVNTIRKFLKRYTLLQLKCSTEFRTERHFRNVSVLLITHESEILLNTYNNYTMYNFAVVVPVESISICGKYVIYPFCQTPNDGPTDKCPWWNSEDYRKHVPVDEKNDHQEYTINRFLLDGLISKK